MKKNVSAIRKVLTETKTGSVVCTKPLKIHFPQRYESVGLSSQTPAPTCLGLFCILFEDYYCIMNAMAMLAMEPNAVSTFSYMGMDYCEWSFEPGSVFIKTKDLVKNDYIVGKVFDEYISNGNVPYYYDYEDYSKILSSAQKYTGANIGASDGLVAVLTSSIARWPHNKQLQYRQGLDAYKGDKPPNPLYVGLSNIDAAVSTVAKLRGAYFEAGVRSAILNPSKRLEETDALIRR